MTEIPTKIFAKASDCGLRCVSSDDEGFHRIEPATDPKTWCLECRQGRWVLSTNGVPQIHFHYDEVLKFLDRFAHCTNIAMP
jgi:hypothetical protein